jgi:PIN domain nuclease of toxin-antitoxin system
MTVLLDTCALIALTRGELPNKASLVLGCAPEAWVSAITPWEVAIKASGGKLRLADPPLTWFLESVDRYTLREIPIDARTTCAAAALPPVHRDPFDRILVALAQAHHLTILTSDENIAKYPSIKTVW